MQIRKLIISSFKKAIRYDLLIYADMMYACSQEFSSGGGGGGQCSPGT